MLWCHSFHWFFSLVLVAIVPTPSFFLVKSFCWYRGFYCYVCCQFFWTIEFMIDIDWCIICRNIKVNFAVFKAELLCCFFSIVVVLLPFFLSTCFAHMIDCSTAVYLLYCVAWRYIQPNPVQGKLQVRHKQELYKKSERI